MQNPLLSLNYNTPHNTFPFPSITVPFIEEAILKGIEEERKEIEAITANTEKPTFQNTIVALANTGELLSRATTVMYNLISAETNDELEALAQRMSPILSEHSSNIMLNASLFERVKTVKESNEEGLDSEDEMLLKETFRAFERSGAVLPEEKKQRFREIKAELSEITLIFSQNRIKETNDFCLHLTEECDLAGLPNGIREAAAATAAEKELPGWCFTLQAPSLTPFLQYSERRDLRKKMYLAANSRCAHNNEHNNFAICQRIVNLRLELAQLLGYECYADYVLENRMAKRKEEVTDLLNNLIDNYLDKAKSEVDSVGKYAKELFESKNASENAVCNEATDDFKLEPWDFGHYSHLLKLRDYNIDAEMLRPYFKLENVIDGVFGLATTLYGITFTPNADIPVYHPDVKAYEVFDHEGSFLAVLYADFFPREGKQSGAWMTSYREQFTDGDGHDHRPHVSLVTNFTKPIPATSDKEGSPSLLTLSEVETFLHEFGHCLHGIFSRSKYASLSGTNVYWDFVELPSQFMENYVMRPEFLHTFARHYQTGELLPEELIKRVRDARNFNVAYACIRQVSFGLLDMNYYTLTHPLTTDIKTFEGKAWNRVQLLPQHPDCCMTVQFGHIMSGGYAAGYYSYKWAEVLDADAFEAFVERGLFSREVANDFREKILSKGGTKHPAQLYRDFRGRDASIEALLRRDGIRSNAQY